MGKNKSASNLVNVIDFNNDRIAFISGSTTLMSISSSGAITVTGVISGSNAASASFALNAGLLNNKDSAEFVATGSFNTFSSSILTYTGSVNSRLGSIETVTGSNITRLSALESASGSAITRLSALETTSGSNITRLNSIETVTGSNITRLNSIESKTGSYATTGSNVFDGGQYLSSSFNPTGFSTTASLYTDGGLRVTRDAYISGTLYLNNVTVFGTQSVAYISSSQLNIGTNLITVNTDTPSIRFGGLAVYDSGSTGLTGSLLWDSQNNHWVYSNPSGSSYSGGMFISGPRTSTLGSETGTTSCMLMAGQGGDHITSSMIYHDSTVTCFHSNSFISASGAACFAGVITGGSDILLTGTNGNLYGGTAEGSAIISNIGGQTYARFFGASHATTPNTTAFVNASSTSATINASGDTCFASNVCALNLVSRCNIRVGVNGGYAVISGPTTGAAISLGTNSATFDRNLSLGIVGGDLSFSPILTINAQTGNVGIGMCTPDRRLYVTDTNATQGTFLAYNQCSTFCGTVIEAITDRTSNSAFNLMNLKSSTTSMFIVKGDGKVGIGVASPAELLEIAGSLKIGNLKIENVNGGSIGFNRNTSNGAIYNCCYAAFQINGPLSNTNYLDFQNYNSSGSYLGSFVFKDGCIGIGTNNPTGTYGKLTVAGGISILDNNTAKLEIGRYSSGAPNSYIKIGTNSNSLRITNAADSVDLLTIENSGIATFACRVCISIGRTNGADSTALVFQDNITGIQTPGFGLRLVYQSNGTGIQSVIGLENGGTGTNNESQISFYTQNTAGGLTKRLLLTSGGDANFSSGTIFAGCINLSNGVITSNGIITKSIGGTMQGVTSTYFDFPTWDDSGQGQMFEIKAFFDHFYNWNYGAHYYVFLTTREGNSQALTMFSCPTGNGGSWMAYKTSPTNLRICKVAGTYGGGGAYWIQVTAKQP
jgi:hypothetical protein